MTTVSDGLTVIVTAIDKNDAHTRYTVYRCERTKLGYNDKLRLDDKDRSPCSDGLLDEEEIKQHLQSHRVPVDTIGLLLREARTYGFRGIHLSADVVDPSLPVIRTISSFLEYLTTVPEEPIKSIVEQAIEDGNEDIISQLATAVAQLNEKAAEVRGANR